MPRTTTEDLKDRENFVKVVAECVTNPSMFSEIFLDHKLFDYNQQYVNCQDRFIVYRSGRQVGKTMSTAVKTCLLYTSPSPRDGLLSRMPSSA